MPLPVTEAIAPEPFFWIVTDFTSENESNESTTASLLNGSDAESEVCTADIETCQWCNLYTFVMYAVVGGLLCLFGCIGNILAFIVFWCDKVKTSTSLLFQVFRQPDDILTSRLLVDF
jgi:hypothetical protein